ncbi:MAG TPA: signal peptidase II [Bauldia sp.]|nr:signal peptidase II [Bauldia sp.]
MFADRPPAPVSPLGIATVLATVAVDQAAKVIAEATLAYAEPVDLLPILTLYRVNNPGIAFSLLAGLGGLGLILMTLAIATAVLFFWWRAEEGGKLAAVGYGLILGGALGNLIDRFTRGEVVDFLLLHFGGWTLFVFNLADAALTVGPVLLVLVYAWPRRREA